MRMIFLIGAVLVCAFMAGWFTVDRDDKGTTIRINRDEIRGDARQAIDRGREYLDTREGQQQPAEQVAQQPYVENQQGGFGQQPQTYPVPPNYQQIPNTQEYQTQPLEQYPPRNY